MTFLKGKMHPKKKMYQEWLASTRIFCCVYQELLHNNSHGFYMHYVFSVYFLCYIGENSLSNKSPSCFDVISLPNTDNFFTAR